MSVSNGQTGNQNTFNLAFLSLLQGGTIAGKVNLRQADSADVNDAQLVINTLLTDLVAANAAIAQLQIDLTNASGGFKVLSQLDLADLGEVVVEKAGALICKLSGATTPVTLAATPFGVDTALFQDGQIIRLYGTSDTNHITLDHNNVDYGVILNGQSVTLKLGISIELMYDETEKRFVEQMRSLNA